MPRKILVLAANPKGTPPLRLDQEVREIDNGLKTAKLRDEFVLRQQWASRPVDVRRAMLDFKPNIVHFCGHGAQEGLTLEDETGIARIITADALSGFFELFSESVDCVLLNACYSETQAKAIAKHIKYVIGMKKGINDSAAIEFAVAFYDALGAGESIEFAYKLACNAVLWAGIPQQLTPTLLAQQSATGEFLQAENTPDVSFPVAFDVDQSGITVANADRIIHDIEVPDPLGPDVMDFASEAEFDASPEDPNSSEWSSLKGLQTYTSIEGFWSSRWSTRLATRKLLGYSNKEILVEGTAYIVVLDDWVYIYYEDQTNRYVIKARMINDRLIGRYINLGRSFDTTPWVGKIIDYRRIDGKWRGGRWDFRR